VLSSYALGSTGTLCNLLAGVEVDAMRTVAKAYQDRSLQVSQPHAYPDLIY